MLFSQTKSKSGFGRSTCLYQQITGRSSGAKLNVIDENIISFK
ncbi:hypothetical protein SAMN05518672_11233 [Chitinophaga sp. CF118]|nr:hypothetical protein SAMN05518672_11233 [Chitinophaga sp. CF118]